MGSYEREMALVEAGKAQRGKTALDYFAELDAKLDEEASHLSHRPDYGKTLFAPEHDDIYREFCAYVDLPNRASSTRSKTPWRSRGIRLPMSIAS